MSDPSEIDNLTELSNPLSDAAARTERDREIPRGNVVAQASMLPFGLQSPRDFELLAHSLEDEAATASWYDWVQVMREGADQLDPLSPQTLRLSAANWLGSRRRRSAKTQPETQIAARMAAVPHSKATRTRSVNDGLRIPKHSAI
jgi:hypothetical protein